MDFLGTKYLKQKVSMVFRDYDVEELKLDIRILKLDHEFLDFIQNFQRASLDIQIEFFIVLKSQTFLNVFVIFSLLSQLLKRVS